MLMQFDSLEAAESFYKEYGKQIGFSVRVRDSQFKKNGQARMKKWVCEKEGEKVTTDSKDAQQKKRRNRREIRQNCEACFQVNLDNKLNQWVVKKFVPLHNHDLTHPKQVQFLRSRWSIGDGDMAQAKSMHDVGVRTNKIIGFLAHQSGGFQNLGFTPKYMYNRMSSAKKMEIQDGDAFTTLGFLSAQKENDLGFYFKHTTKEDGQLGNLFWSDSMCRLDYSVFGDVLAFDVCYKRSVYCTPLVTLVGVNHHRQSIVFGCALLADEQKSSYIWLLNNFLQCMSGKMPVSVVTDGDLSIRAAICHVFPTVRHGLCSWHIQRNATREVKNPDFNRDFGNMMYKPMQPNDFEANWTSMILRYDLNNNSWIQHMYEDRKLWAEAYLNGYFFGIVKTTSRCEGFHSFLNEYLSSKISMLELVKQFGRALDKICYNEQHADHVALHSNPACNHVLKAYEKQAAEKYTPSCLLKFQEELHQESAYLMDGFLEYEKDNHIYKLQRFLKQGHSRRVVFNSSSQTIKCSCMHFESWGFPCRHSIAVMKLEQLSCIPESLFLNRWTKSAKNHFLDTCEKSTISDDVLSVIRYGSLTSTCKKNCVNWPPNPLQPSKKLQVR